MKEIYYYDAPIGTIQLTCNEGFLEELAFGTTKKQNPKELSSTLKKVLAQLELYFKGELQSFDLPLRFIKGTPFQQNVWNALLSIPYGKTASYKDIATLIGNPKAVRAVGGANNKNPLPIIIPCHRVIGSSGKMVGYAGGVDIKEFLLTLEKSSL